MRRVYQIGLAALAAVIAFTAIQARAETQPKDGTSTDAPRAWSPQPSGGTQTVASAQPGRAVASAPPSAPLLPPVSSGTADYQLGTGDKVRITVFGEEDLSGEFQVDSTGYLRLPVIGQVRAAGFTGRALEESLTSTYANGYLKEPRVNVEVTTYRPFYIIGEVNKPGEYAYVNGMNVLNAVALAGGFTEKAVESHVYLRKNGTAKEITVAGDQTTQIMPGDIVRVTSSPLWDALSIIGPLSPFATAIPRL